MKAIEKKLNQLKYKLILSYIIGLKEPGHCKEGLGGFCGPKMLPLYEYSQKWERVKMLR